MSKDLDGAGALVTGGASGLGAATCRALAARGAQVAVVDRDGDRAAELAAAIGGKARAFAADVTAADQLAEAVDGAVAAFGELRVAVLCAGIGWAERVVGRDGPAPLEPF